MLIKLKEPVNAMMYLERANRMDSGNYITHSLLGQAYRMVGRTEDAAREAQISQKIQDANQPKLEAIH